MATGAGKTFTAITEVYRLLKFADAKRVLFLVDTKNLGEQAEQEFMAYVPRDDTRSFAELYALRRLQSSFISPDSQVCISTIQRMYSILKGEPLDEAAEETHPAEIQSLAREPMPVVYNARIPVEFFDFIIIIIDECHRSIYNVWQQVLDYFDAFLIGLTATPDSRTFGFFNQNVVSEYSRDEAISDGVNVGHEVFEIDTKISSQGGTLKAQMLVEKRDKLTRRRRWERPDEDTTYGARELDRSVVNPSQVRTVLQTFRQSLPEMFPGREEVPKTLIFAKSDSHADDIIRMVREVFDEGNQFCKKVTYEAAEKPKSVLSQFRNDFYPRIAVTVDMIATGTDVKPLECLLFMRDVKSRNYFEQMQGRGTRTLDYDNLKQVTPSARGPKTHFVLVDAVGVTRSIKTESKPLDSKPRIALKDLLQRAMMGVRDDETLSSLGGRLARLDRQLTPEDRQQVEAVSGGVSVQAMVRGLLAATNPDAIEDRARQDYGLSPGVEPTPEQLAEARTRLADAACNVFTGRLIDCLDNIRREHEQTIDIQNLDRLERAEWAGDAAENARLLTQELQEYCEAHRDEIAALAILYGEPYRRRELTFALVRELLERLRQERPKLAPIRVWDAFALLDEVRGSRPETELEALVSLVRRVCGLDEAIGVYPETVRRNFQRWVMQAQEGNAPKFTSEQMQWLRGIRDHVAKSFHLEREDLELSPFNNWGGLGKMYELFGDKMDDLIGELNEALAA